MPGDMSGAIASQVGASGGLWTHTPVDWRGNETGQAPPGPAGWPTSPYVATPPAASTGSIAIGGISAPQISAISASGITTTGATINFTLSQAATAYVEYGLTTLYGSTNTPASGNGAQSKPLTGLTTGTVYHYRVVASSAGSTTTYSADRTFTTS